MLKAPELDNSQEPSQPLVSVKEVENAWPLLDALPYPVMLIDVEHQMQRVNKSGADEYGTIHGQCYRISHGYESPCDKNGEPCPKVQAERSGKPVSVLHVHQTTSGTARYKVAAVPIANGGILEFHIPLDDVTTTDLLTGLITRTEAEQNARRCAQLMRRMKSGYTVMMVDLDHFKNINDSYGHPTGDAVLKAVGGILNSAARETDIAARWGGEEFLLMLPSLEKSGADEFAQRLLAEIRTLEFLIDEITLRVTASIGVRCVSSNESSSVSFDQAVSDSDIALYQAKHDGRNRVTVYIRE